MSITWAAVLGAAARLRPILMTSLAMIVGLLPLMFASGAGANGNRTLGTSAIGGMLIGMILQIFIVPACSLLSNISRRRLNRWNGKMWITRMQNLRLNNIQNSD